MKLKNLKRSAIKSTPWKRKQLKNCRLYCILDIKKSPASIVSLAEKIASAGVDIIQLRNVCDKSRKLLAAAKIVRARLAQRRVIIIINNRLDIARLSGADGVHLGQEDISVKDARGILGKERIVGVSCHSRKQAIKAEKDGADYISIGPIYATPTKPNEPAIGLDACANLASKITIPIFAIGGINANNIVKLKDRQISRIAVYRAIVKQKNPAKSATRLKQILLQD